MKITNIDKKMRRIIIIGMDFIILLTAIVGSIICDLEELLCRKSEWQKIDDD